MRIQIFRTGALVLGVALCLFSALQASGQDRDVEAVIGSWEGVITGPGANSRLYTPFCATRMGASAGPWQAPTRAT